MQNSDHTFFFAKTIAELFYQLTSVSGLEVVGGCTSLERMPQKAISVHGIPELASITMHERYLDCGPAVALSDILSLASARIPEALTESVKSIANPFVRNIATIGGNICAGGIRRTLYAPLLALDARLELKSALDTVYVPLLNFTSIPHGSILSNIRIPLGDWDVTVFRRLGADRKITETSASFAFLADNEKNMITNIKLAFSGVVTFRCIELENRLIGTRLPLATKDISLFTDTAALQFDAAAKDVPYNPILRTQFVNLTRYSLEQLT